MTCATENPNIKRNCVGCGKPRQRRQTSRDKHMAVLRDLSYEECVEINGGEHCGICGAGPKTRRLDGDHEHKGNGTFRGLCCFRCNAALRDYMTLDWLRAAVIYLERFEARKETNTDVN